MQRTYILPFFWNKFYLALLKKIKEKHDSYFSEMFQSCHLAQLNMIDMILIVLVFISIILVFVILNHKIITNRGLPSVNKAVILEGIQMNITRARGVMLSSWGFTWHP